MLGAPNNSFTVGNGDVVDTVNGDVIGPILIWKESDKLFQTNSDIVYESKSSSIWIEIDVSKGFFWFNIYYYISPINEGKIFNDV